MTGMRFRVVTLLLVGGVMVGIVAGFIAPKPVAATTYWVYIQLWPGGGSTLTCGWHSGPCYNDDEQVSSGSALDWSTVGTISFNVKSSTDSPIYAIAGTATVTAGQQSACSHYVYAELKDNNAQSRGQVTYVHTAASGETTVYIDTEQYNLVPTTEGIGSAAYEGGCGDSWGGYHVHQDGTSGWTLANYPDHSQCNRPTITTSCGIGNSTYMGYANWTVQYP